MNKNILYSVAIAMMMLLAACSNDDNLPEVETRTMSFSVNMPEEGPDTRVTLTKDGQDIKLKWVVGDKIDLAFYQEGEDAKLKLKVNIDRVSNDDRTAHFTIAIPTSITGDFTLFGAYGGGGIKRIDVDGVFQPVVNLPEYPTNAIYLNGTSSVHSRKDVVLYFEHPMNSSNESAKVTFKHLGFLMNFTVKNNSGADIIGLEPIDILPFPSANYSGYRWFYDGSNSIFNLIDKTFTATLNTQGAFGRPFFNIPSGGSLTSWFWQPAMGIKWPQIKIFMKWAGLNTAAGTQTYKNERTPVAGKSYYLWAKWSGTELDFTDEANLDVK